MKPTNKLPASQEVLYYQLKEQCNNSLEALYALYPSCPHYLIEAGIKSYIVAIAGTKAARTKKIEGPYVAQAKWLTELAGAKTFFEFQQVTELKFNRQRDLMLGTHPMRMEELAPILEKHSKPSDMLNFIAMVIRMRQEVAIMGNRSHANRYKKDETVSFIPEELEIDEIPLDSVSLDMYKQQPDQTDVNQFI